VLTRLSPRGEVAHEEDIGEFPFSITCAPRLEVRCADLQLQHDRRQLHAGSVAAEWLLNMSAADRARKNSWRTWTAAMVSHANIRRRSGQQLEFVLQGAAKFADDPRAQNLISLKPGFSAGQWRDSNDGLAAAFALRCERGVRAAALDAAQRFFESVCLTLLGTLTAHLLACRIDGENLARQGRSLFDVTLPSATVREDITRYAADLNLSTTQHALWWQLTCALPRPVAECRCEEHSHRSLGRGLELLFGHPSSAALRQALTAIMRPFQRAPDRRGHRRRQSGVCNVCHSSQLTAAPTTAP